MTTVPTLAEIQKETTWVWVHCEAQGCGHSSPMAIVPLMIRWGGTHRATSCADLLGARAADGKARLSSGRAGRSEMATGKRSNERNDAYRLPISSKMYCSRSPSDIRLING
jgi:hypothetical protein